jgi:chromosome segregation ATPase
MIGVVLDSVLMLLLVAALGYGVRLEKKLSALRAGQLAFAGAVNELNAAAGRAQSALADLRAAGEDADLLHDRIIKARTLKGELETLMSRMERAERQVESRPAAPRTERTSQERPRIERTLSAPAEDLPTREAPVDDERARRMQALADRIQGMAGSRAARPGQENVSAILGALNAGSGRVSDANHAVQDRINRARRNLDEDLFAA